MIRSSGPSLGAVYCPGHDTLGTSQVWSLSTDTLESKREEKALRVMCEWDKGMSEKTQNKYIRRKEPAP